jgi:glucuronate isomerase
MVLHLTTAAIQEVGSTPRGRLFIFPILGGSFEGDRVRGKVLAGGADWATATADGAFELDLRATLEADDGALIYLTFTGVRDDARQYLRSLPRFETAASRYDFLNRLLAVGIGEIRPGGPVHIIEELL